MPASDIARSADFYKKVFGGNIRERGNGQRAFDETTTVPFVVVMNLPEPQRLGT
jgi:predicted enzyme related to lactoylglutathione lyase